MSNKPLTVLICCHNHEPYIPRCINSLIDQTLSKDKFKVLFLLDGCTDKSEETINRIKENEDKEKDGLEIQIITKPAKQGLAVAKNFALRHVDTEFIAFQDCDDQSMPDRLEMQLDVITGNKKVYQYDYYVPVLYSPDVVGTLSWTELEDGRLVKSCFDVGQYVTRDEIAARIPHENIMTHGSVMLRKSALDSVGWYLEDKKFLGMEDWILWAKMIQRGFQFYQIQERLYIWSGGTSVPR